MFQGDGVGSGGEGGGSSGGFREMILLTITPSKANSQQWYFSWS